MERTKIKNFANEIGMPVNVLLEQLQAAGIHKNDPTEDLSEQDKSRLLHYLRESHGNHKVVLKRKETSVVRQVDASGKVRTIPVEVRKKRVLVRKETIATETGKAEKPVEEATPVLENAVAEKMPESVTPDVVADQPVEAAVTLDGQFEHEKEHLAEDSAESEEKKQPETKEKEIPEDQSPVVTEESKPLAQVEAAQEPQQAAAAEEILQEKASEEPQSQASIAEEEDLGEREENSGVSLEAEEISEPAQDDKLEEVLTLKDKKVAKATKKPERRKEREKPHVSSADRHKGKIAPQKTFKKEEKPEPKVMEIIIPETITVGQLAQKMAVKAAQLIKTLMGMGVMATINQVLDQETAMLVTHEMGFEAKAAKPADPEAYLEEHTSTSAAVLPRPPVVTVMGHVDHGKTSLLDYIRKTKVASGEAGGITQHIGAYHVKTAKGSITFLDTPGHEAFTAMRARGAKATDIVILVVAADDGVMPQTIEAIHHAKAANVPIVVAITKIDRPEADPDRVKQEVSNYGVIPEEWGGDTLFAEVSAKTGQGIDELLDLILLQAEMLELKAPKDTLAKGIIVEARLDRGRGPVATVLVQSGTLKVGDIVLVGSTYGRVRAMLNELGQRVEQALPSTPVEILGLSEVPKAGEELIALTDEKKAREIAFFRQGKYRDVRLAKQQAARLDNLFDKIKEGVQTLPLVIKADVQGSVEALADALKRLSTDEVKIDIVHSGVGAITESDVNLAIASSAVIIGFNTRPDSTARKLIESSGVDVRYYDIIYQVVDDVKAAMTGMLAPEEKEEIIGLAEIRQIFRVPKIGTVAGAMVRQGVLRRGAKARLLRDNVVIATTEIDSLKRFKDDVREVREGFECGFSLKNLNDLQEGDQVEAYEIKEVARTL